VAWNDTIRSLGKTGVLGTDGRQNLRVDNKIPYFTADEIDQLDFNLTYGGFDRLNNQFLWSYKKADTESATQDSVLVGNYEENTWCVYDQRFSVFGQTDLGLNLTWDDIDETTGNDSWATWDTTEDLWDRIGVSQAVQKTLAGDDFGFIYELNKSYDDYFTNISAITTGVTTTLTVNETAILAGDLLSISGVVGLLNDQGESGINNFDPATSTQTSQLYEVISATNTSIVINLDSSALTAYVSGGSVAKVISAQATTIPFNPYRQQGCRCYVSHLEFIIESTGSTLLVDVFADQQPTPVLQNIMLKPSVNSTSADQWMSMSVDIEAEFLTFRIKHQSPAVQYRQKSMIIYCEKGGMVHG